VQDVVFDYQAGTYTAYVYGISPQVAPSLLSMVQAAMDGGMTRCLPPVEANYLRARRRQPTADEGVVATARAANDSSHDRAPYSSLELALM